MTGRPRRTRIGALSAVLLASNVFTLSAVAADIIVLGDSWGVPAAPALQSVLQQKQLPHTVVGKAVGGESAYNMNTPEGLQFISDTLAQHPTAQFIHLSIGGNDFLTTSWNATWPEAKTAQQLQEMVSDVASILDHIFNQRPDIRVFWAGYDYLRPIPTQGTPAEINTLIHLIADASQALADTMPNVEYYDSNGAMQQIYGFDGFDYTLWDPPVPIHASDPALPSALLPGPAAAFPVDDPIHLSLEAYDHLAELQYEVYYSKALGTPVPSGSGATDLVLAGLMFIGGVRALRSRRPATLRLGSQKRGKK